MGDPLARRVLVKVFVHKHPSTRHENLTYYVTCLAHIRHRRGACLHQPMYAISEAIVTGHVHERKCHVRSASGRGCVFLARARHRMGRCVRAGGRNHSSSDMRRPFRRSNSWPSITPSSFILCISLSSPKEDANVRCLFGAGSVASCACPHGVDSLEIEHGATIPYLDVYLYL